MRALGCVAGLFVVACACEPTVHHEPLPDWSGPPLQVIARADRGIDVELQAPTGGHRFELVRVDRAGDAADVHFLHRTPGDAFVTQVITPLRVGVPAGELGGVRRVRILIATAEGAGGAVGGERLAFVLLRS